VERLRHREIGSGLEYHRRRAVEQASLMAREEDRDGVLVLETTAKSVPEVAREVLRGMGW
jgi:regulator of PEP synthase PpsR (kinase-PPPase family)